MIDPSHSPQILNIGERIFLYCKALGYPIPTVQWYRGRIAEVPIAHRFQQLTSVRADTPGTRVYTCIGRNNAGGIQHSEHKNITVIFKGETSILYCAMCSSKS